MTPSQIKMESSIGTLWLVATPEGLCGVYWRRQRASGKPEGKAAKILARAASQIEQYLAGKRRDFDVPLDVKATPFQRKVWDVLLRIPYGETKTYAEVARQVGKPKAVRAVGAANGRNPVSILVPCHRVIASGGSLQGYSGGLEKKRRLLELEKN